MHNLDFKKILLILFVFILPLLSINMQRKEGLSEDFRKSFFYISGLAQKLFMTTSGGIFDSITTYLNLIDIKKENKKLKSQLAQSKAKVLSFEQLQIENQRFRKLLDFKQTSKIDLIFSKVIAYDLLTDTSSTIKIDKGYNDGVKPNLAVINFDGLAGYILEVFKNHSLVLLVTDSRSSIDALVQRTRARAIVVGNKNSLILKYLNRTDDVQIGDLVVSSGLDNKSSKGLPIGKVIFVNKKSYGITQDVRLKPLIDPLKLEEVFVVTGEEL